MQILGQNSRKSSNRNHTSLRMFRSPPPFLFFWSGKKYQGGNQLYRHNGVCTRTLRACFTFKRHTQHPGQQTKTLFHCKWCSFLLSHPGLAQRDVHLSGFAQFGVKLYRTLLSSRLQRLRRRRRIRAFARHWFKYALEKVCLVAVSATRARCGSMERVCVVMIIVDEVWGLCSPGWQWQAVFFVPNVHWHGRRSPLL